MNLSLPTPQVTIQTIPANNLHTWWEFVERGLNDIRRKVPTDWLPPDVYGALRGDHATLILVSRGTKPLGFVVFYKQARPWSGKPDLFVWAAWAIPLRERQLGDNVWEAVLLTLQYLRDLKRTMGTEALVFVSSRKGFARRFGFKPMFITYWD